MTDDEIDTTLEQLASGHAAATEALHALAAAKHADQLRPAAHDGAQPLLGAAAFLSDHERPDAEANLLEAAERLRSAAE